MTDDSDFPDLYGVFAPTSSSAQRRERWLTPAGRTALQAALGIARTGGSWQEALAGLPYVEETFDPDPRRSRRDLRAAPLDGLDLTGADLRAAHLDEATATAAKLGHANLREASADGADFTGADLQEAELTEFSGRATFRNCRLDRAVLVDAVLVGSDFRDASLTDSDLTNANLLGANLVGADLSGAVTTNAFFGEFRSPEEDNGVSDRTQRRERWLTPSGQAALRSALDLARVGGPWQEALAELPYVDETFEPDPVHSLRDLRGAPLDGIDLSGADLHGARLDEATATATKMERVNLRGARFLDADFTRADLREADLTRVRGRGIFCGARLDHALFIGSELQGCDFADASLLRTDFSEASLLECGVTALDLREAVVLHTYFGP